MCWISCLSVHFFLLASIKIWIKWQNIWVQILIFKISWLNLATICILIFEQWLLKLIMVDPFIILYTYKWSTGLRIITLKYFKYVSINQDSRVKKSSQSLLKFQYFRVPIRFHRTMSCDDIYQYIQFNLMQSQKNICSPFL